MLLRYTFACCCLLIGMTTFAQIQLPVLYASDSLLDVRVGEELQEGAWTLMPELRPDSYISHEAGQKITFISNLDSISCVVSKNAPFDFVVVQGQDSAFTQVRYETSKLDILKAHADYEKVQRGQLPVFTYQSADSQPLRELREKYRLDSIAGQGNDISQMLNLMRWVHNSIEHNGNLGNKGEQNADAFLSSCGSGKGTLNCRGLGIVLNEVYLAMGFPSRFVTCLPRDSTDFDCHVINTAYSQALNKWVWLDPTQNAYAMDEKGQLLSISEVRERLVNDSPVILNPDANWNYRGTTDKAWYLDYYMAKNLYRFSTPLHSTYDYETDGKGKQITYVELWPAGEGKHLPPLSEKMGENGMKYVTHRTNNPLHFWTIPAVDPE